MILNNLGEHYHESSKVREDTELYLSLIDEIANRGVGASISVKLSQIGIDVSPELYERHAHGPSKTATKATSSSGSIGRDRRRRMRPSEPS